jgi:hypothetical protein
MLVPGRLNAYSIANLERIAFGSEQLLKSVDHVVAILVASVMEDITATTADIALLAGFRVFATVRSTGGHQRIALSPATRSRFTEILVSQYDVTELQKVLVFELRRRVLPRGMDESAVQVAAQALFKVQDPNNCNKFCLLPRLCSIVYCVTICVTGIRVRAAGTQALQWAPWM